MLGRAVSHSQARAALSRPLSSFAVTTRPPVPNSTLDCGGRTSTQTSSTAMLAHPGKIHTFTEHTPRVEPQAPRSGYYEQLVLGSEDQARREHKTIPSSASGSSQPQQCGAEVSTQRASCADLIASQPSD
eukprot:TRINITY_DN17204_c0_g1_i1.p1 TRINITY_DN17204_c0_g1~~TRINITY_DN17204_c0_g1_i1.p1  ORF type:complete len:130 (-),score=17.43 TRINITY_DN17204_c0_g1_i1:459-848(-)